MRALSPGKIHAVAKTPNVRSMPFHGPDSARCQGLYSSAAPSRPAPLPLRQVRHPRKGRGPAMGNNREERKLDPDFRRDDGTEKARGTHLLPVTAPPP